MNRTLRFAPLLLTLTVISARAQTPTWADDVACIVYSHCTPCHHEGGAGHFSMMTYADAFSRKGDMRDATALKLMPPWPPDENYTDLAHERVLTQDEIDIIAAWADGGGPEGVPGNAPDPPVYDNEWVIDAPDISVRIEDFVIPASTEDLYRCFVMPGGTTSDEFITGFEVIPGNTEVVHHVLVFQDTSGQAQVLDDADPAPGYTSFGGIGVTDAKLVGFWVPGSQPYFTPAGFGINLLAGADLVMQVHYPAGSDAQLDSTRINFQLTSAPFTRNLGLDAILEHFWTMTDGPLIIPANTIQTFHNQYTTIFPAIVTAIAPHAHLVCTHMKSFAVTPANDTIRFVDIPAWDFAWQGLYEFRNPIYLPTGTVLHGEATYDNTAANPNNPNDPPALVTLGEATTDEMMLFYFAWSFGFPSDTNLVIDDAPHTPHHEDCEVDFPIGITEATTVAAARIWPSPAHDVLNIECSPGASMFLLHDADGRLVHDGRLSTGVNTIDISGAAPGAYVVEVRGTNGRVLNRSSVVLE